MSFFSRQLGGGPETFGYLQAAVAFGAILGAFALATRTAVLGLERWVVAASVLFGAAILGLSRVGSTTTALVLLIPAGFAFMIQLATTNTLLQTRAPDRLRGRVMSIHTSIFLGIFPLAGLVAGACADHFGEGRVMSVSGTTVALATFVWGRRLLRSASSEAITVTRR